MVVQTHCIQEPEYQQNLFYKTVGREKWEPDVDEVVINQGKGIVRPYHRDTVSLFEGSIEAQNRSLKVSTGFFTRHIRHFFPLYGFRNK